MCAQSCLCNISINYIICYICIYTQYKLIFPPKSFNCFYQNYYHCQEMLLYMLRHFTKKALKSGNCYTHAHTYRHTYAHIHTYMHTHMCTHTHISSSLQLFNSQYYTPPRLPYVLMEVCGDSGPLFYKGKISPPRISRPSLKHPPWSLMFSL